VALDELTGAVGPRLGGALEPVDRSLAVLEHLGVGLVALGSGLLLVAGVPATLLGALAVVVAVAFLAAPVEPAETAAGGGVRS
jgi:hypothetical protein